MSINIDYLLRKVTPTKVYKYVYKYTVSLREVNTFMGSTLIEKYS
jgi:hypothetical protein